MTSAEYQQLAASLEHLSTEMGHRFTELRQERLGHFDAIYHRFERLEQEYHFSP